MQQYEAFIMGKFCLYPTNKQMNCLFIEIRDSQDAFIGGDHVCFGEYNFLFLRASTRLIQFLIITSISKEYDLFSIKKERRTKISDILAHFYLGESLTIYAVTKARF